MILIRNAQIVDGTGRPPFSGDVLVKGTRISAIGSFPNKRSDTVIDALGMTLAPGFIDINNASDHFLTLFTNPSHEDFLAQGITSVIGGQCGSSLAPLLYGTLESIRKWADTNDINVSWHTLGEFFRALGRLPLGMNFGTFIGHATIRRSLIGEDMRDLTESELAVLKSIVSRSFREGALGISFGLGYAHGRGTPFAELRALAALAAEARRPVGIHLRNERERLAPAVQEAIRIAEATGATVIVSHLRPYRGYERQFERALALLESHAASSQLYFDSAVTDACIIPLYTLLPQWAQRGNLETMLGYLRDPGTRARILRELAPVPGEDLAVVRAPEAPYLAGVTLAQFARDREAALPEALLMLMEATELRAAVRHRTLNIDWALASFRSPRALFGSNVPSVAAAGVPSGERLVQRFLTAAVATKVMRFEEAVARLTSVPAKLLGLEGRGVIAEGAIADLVLLERGSVHSVMVGGTMAFQDGRHTDARSGAILERTRA